MKYAGMPQGMWLLYQRSFRRELTAVLGIPDADAKEIARGAKKRYREIIARLPEFEKGDRFKMNLVNSAVFAAFYLGLGQKPTLAQATDYYERAMMTAPTRWFCRMGGKSKFSQKDVDGMRRTAAFKAADRNPYSWNMDYLPYPDGSCYEARFTKCGICVLMKELGISDVTPALCHLDYAMSKAGGASVFVREHTLAAGGPYCDCGYRRKTT